MKAAAKKKNPMFRAAVIAAAVLFACLVLYATLFQVAAAPELSGWQDENGAAMDLMEQRAMQKGETRTIYATLPATAGGRTLAIRTENVTVKVWVGTLFLYKTPATALGSCPGDRLVLLTLPLQSGGALLRIEATAPLATGSLPVRHIYYGESLAILKLLMRNAIPSLLLNGALLFSGIALFLSFSFQGWHRRTPTSWLGLSVTALSGWTLTQTYIVLAAELPLFWFLSAAYALVPLGACFLFLYLADCWVGARHVRTTYLCWAGLCGAWAPLCVILDVTGVAPFPSSKPVSCMLLGASALAMLAHLGAPLREKQHASLQLPGFVLLLLGMGMDAIRANLRNTLDYALYTRIGLMVFVVCIALESAYGISRSIRQAARADALQRAAYLDALTGLYNRRAYERDFAALSAAPTQSAIIMMDINDLKQANDKHGHTQGDELIRAAARVISNAFEGYGDCYRYGGDEFVILIRDEPENCVAALRRIPRLTEAENHMNAGLHPPLHIAVGYAIYRPEQGDTLVGTQRLADERMYANKKEGKARSSMV